VERQLSAVTGCGVCKRDYSFGLSIILSDSHMAGSLTVNWAGGFDRATLEY